jgi:hypothetical protein
MADIAVTSSLRGAKRSAESATPDLDETAQSHSKIRRLTSASGAQSRSNTPDRIQASNSHPSPRARFASQADEIQIIENEEETSVDNDLLEDDVSIRVGFYAIAVFCATTESSYILQTLVIHSIHQHVAAAFHDSETSIISFLEDTEDSKTFDLITTRR